MKMTLKEAFTKYKLNHALVEERSGIPYGIIAQLIHGRPCSEQRLKALNKGLQSLGEEVSSIKLIQE